MFTSTRQFCDSFSVHSTALSPHFGRLDAPCLSACITLLSCRCWTQLSPSCCSPAAYLQFSLTKVSSVLEQRSFPRQTKIATPPGNPAPAAITPRAGVMSKPPAATPTGPVPPPPPGAGQHVSQSPTNPEQPVLPPMLEELIIYGIPLANRPQLTDPGIIYRNQSPRAGKRKSMRQASIYSPIAPAEDGGVRRDEGVPRATGVRREARRDVSATVGSGWQTNVSPGTPSNRMIYGRENDLNSRLRGSPVKSFIPEYRNKSPASKVNAAPSGWKWGQPQDGSKP